MIKLLWKLQYLLSEVPAVTEPKVLIKNWCKSNKPFWWCGVLVIGLGTPISKMIRENSYVRYTIRCSQAQEFETWLYYYLTLFWQIITGIFKGMSLKGAYCTSPFIVESYFYERNSDSIYYVYPFGRWKKFKLTNRKDVWKKEKKHWKTFIRQNFDGIS